MNRLATTLCGIPLSNPVIAASGTYAYGIEFRDVTDLNAIGGIVVKGLSREPMAGNKAPRLWETQGGMMNSIGLQNIGARAFVEQKLPELRQFRTAVIANVFGYTPEDYAEVLRVLNDAEGIAAYELNVSCPNTKHGGIFFSSDPELLASLVSELRQLTRRPLIVKLSPNVARIDIFARAAQEAGADAISLVNTYVAFAVNPETRTPRIAAGYAGLSGPAVKPIALRMVLEAARAVEIPVIGIGGIQRGEDAAEFLTVGAAAVEVGTVSFYDPGAPARIARELGQWMAQANVDNTAALTRTLQI